MGFNSGFKGLNTSLDIIRDTKMIQILTKHLCLPNNSVVLISHQDTQHSLRHKENMS